MHLKGIYEWKYINTNICRGEKTRMGENEKDSMKVTEEIEYRE